MSAYRINSIIQHKITLPRILLFNSSIFFYFHLSIFIENYCKLPPCGWLTNPRRISRCDIVFYLFFPSTSKREVNVVLRITGKMLPMLVLHELRVAGKFCFSYVRLVAAPLISWEGWRIWLFWLQIDFGVILFDAFSKWVEWKWVANGLRSSMCMEFRKKQERCYVQNCGNPYKS